MATDKAEVDRLYHEFEAARQALVASMQDLRETPPSGPRMARRHAPLFEDDLEAYEKLTRAQIDALNAYLHAKEEYERGGG